VASELRDPFRANGGSITGVQACLWSEKLNDQRLFNCMVFPHLSAIAESAWTPSARKDFGRFRAMLAHMPGLSD
jgi:hexosaminidase